MYNLLYTYTVRYIRLALNIILQQHIKTTAIYCQTEEYLLPMMRKLLK